MYEYHYKYIKRKYDANLLFTDTDSLFLKLKQMGFKKIFMRIKICLILVTIQKIQSFLTLSIKKLLVKRKMNSKEK